VSSFYVGCFYYFDPFKAISVVVVVVAVVVVVTTRHELICEKLTRIQTVSLTRYSKNETLNNQKQSAKRRAESNRKWSDRFSLCNQ